MSENKSLEDYLNDEYKEFLYNKKSTFKLPNYKCKEINILESYLNEHNLIRKIHIGYLFDISFCKLLHVEYIEIECECELSSVYRFLKNNSILKEIKFKSGINFDFILDNKLNGVELLDETIDMFSNLKFSVSFSFCSNLESFINEKKTLNVYDKNISKFEKFLKICYENIDNIRYYYLKKSEFCLNGVQCDIQFLGLVRNYKYNFSNYKNDFYLLFSKKKNEKIYKFPYHLIQAYFNSSINNLFELTLVHKLKILEYIEINEIDEYYVYEVLNFRMKIIKIRIKKYIEGKIPLCVVKLWKICDIYDKNFITSPERILDYYYKFSKEYIIKENNFKTFNDYDLTIYYKPK